MDLNKERVFKGKDDKYYVAANSSYADDQTIVLNHQDTFGIFDRWGDVQPFGKKLQGIYHDGTRYINQLEFRLNDFRPVLLSSTLKEDNEIMTIDLTNVKMQGRDGVMIEADTIHINRSKFVKNGKCYEAITLKNYGQERVSLEVEVAVGGDFKDIFEVRGITRDKVGDLHQGVFDKNVWRVTYDGLDGVSRISDFMFSKEPDIYKGNKFKFHLDLDSGEDAVIDYSILFKTSGGANDRISFDDAKEEVKEKVEQYKLLISNVFTSNEQFNHWINRSRADLLSLISETPHGKYPYAGVPWYNTAFGRDGIITAMQTLWIAPEISRNVLTFLFATQAQELDETKDAEPGKIFHEMRGGEMANTGEVPFSKYYGTIDATPLFIMLAGMYYQRTKDLKTIEYIWSGIEKALYWIDNYGDIDGDGFVEYKHKAKNGLTNQGWKDSFDSISYEDGELCEAPIALCEVQGYVYQAKIEASKLAAVLKREELKDTLLKEAKALKKRFNEVFWDEEMRSYVLALDGNKKPCKVMSSNAGHLLFTGIVDKKKSRVLSRRLLEQDMYSGWGVRTLSEKAKRYNPLSYHNGSIWPHDNSLIAAGMSKYGCTEEMLKIVKGMFDASIFLELQRLPELFCGFERRYSEGPTNYPVACSPQGWAVGAVFLFIKAMLRIEIDAINKTIVFNNPKLPEYLEKVELKDLDLGNENCHLELYRYRYDVGFNIIQKPDDWEIIIKK